MKSSVRQFLFAFLASLSSLAPAPPTHAAEPELRVGESIPKVQPFLVLVGNRLGVVAGIQYYDVTTGFEVNRASWESGYSSP